MSSETESELQIPAALWRVMLAHGQVEYPLEACGLLGGRNGRVCHLYAIENHLRSPVRYEMDPLQQIQALLHLEDQGDDLLAIYHTHPHGPETPSPTDVDLATFSAVVYVIVSLTERANPIVRGFYITHGEVSEVALTTTANALWRSN
jgi:[CysO sulfur-carrier protein]-S-L-cysteine hydrolase